MNAQVNPASAPYVLPELPFEYSALAPVMSAEVLELHHGKHHAAYVKGANDTLEHLADPAPWQVPGLEQSLAFNVGGHVLHSLFWNCLSPQEQRPEGDLAAAITDQFGSFDTFRTRFTEAITTVQGSGWALLSWEPTARRLVIQQVRDHQGGHIVGAHALLIADVWEHAYYLDHRNAKDKWADAFFKLADWHSAAGRFDDALRAAGATAAR